MCNIGLLYPAFDIADHLMTYSHHIKILIWAIYIVAHSEWNSVRYHSVATTIIIFVDGTSCPIRRFIELFIVSIAGIAKVISAEVCLGGV